MGNDKKMVKFKCRMNKQIQMQQFQLKWREESNGIRIEQVGWVGWVGETMKKSSIQW